MVVTESSCRREMKVVSGIPIKANNVPGTAQSAIKFSLGASNVPQSQNLNSALSNHSLVVGP